MPEMYEQAWFTWSRVGLSNRPSYQLRAASAGLLARDTPLRRAIEYECRRVHLPPAILPEEARSRRLFSLVLRQFDGLSVLARRVALPSNDALPDSHVFSHIIASEGVTIPLRSAVRSWDSSFWAFESRSIAQDQTELKRLDSVRADTRSERDIRTVTCTCTQWRFVARSIPDTWMRRSVTNLGNAV